MMLLRRMLDESRQASFTLLLQVWVLVAFYAMLHDQYVIRIAPEHFTVYHRPLWGIQNHTLLAATWGFLGSLAPGLLLGLGCLMAARAGGWPKLSARIVLRGVALVLAATELCSATAGIIVFRRGSGLFPADWYVEASLPLLVTQTIQITCYLVGACFAALLFVCLIALRHRKRFSPDESLA